MSKKLTKRENENGKQYMYCLLFKANIISCLESDVTEPADEMDIPSTQGKPTKQTAFSANKNTCFRLCE